MLFPVLSVLCKERLPGSLTVFILFILILIFKIYFSILKFILILLARTDHVVTLDSRKTKTYSVYSRQQCPLLKIEV